MNATSARTHRVKVVQSVCYGFSLVEVTIAIGIFAFVIVGIMGLFPAALRQRGDAAVETRAVMAAQQVFEGVRSSSSTTSIFLPPFMDMSGSTNTLAQKSLSDFPLSLQYGRSGTAILRPKAGDSDWINGATETDADALARVRIQSEPGAAPGLYRVSVDYGRPASLNESQRKNFTFSKLVYLP
jgi:type II secretory pathway pseudopilin PulG